MLKILLGYDGSEGADAALVDLRRAGLPGEAEALIVSVADVMKIPDTSNYVLVGQGLTSRRTTSALLYAERQSAQVLQEAKELANKARVRVQSYFPDWKVRAEALAGTASTELIQKANEWKPDLVVLGSNGRSALGRFILGSVSKKLAADLNHSVRVVRRVSKERTGAPKIIIGVDGSTEAERAVREVGMRVWPKGTEVRVVAVDDDTFSGTAQMVPGNSVLITGCNEEPVLAAVRMVEWAQSELSAIDLKVSSHIIKGDPVVILLEQASNWDADSIFVGARNLSGALERFWLGSVSTALVTKAHCSVEIVRGTD